MTQLKKLIQSLTTVLVRYHDIQGVNIQVSGTDPKTPHSEYGKKAAELLGKENPDTVLENLNNEFMDKYPERRELLKYLKNIIISLHKLSIKTETSSDSELNKYSKMVVQLVTDLKVLLATKKSVKYTVALKLPDKAPESFALKGLYDDGYLAFGLCASGSLIQEEVLKLFAELTDKELEETIIGIFLEHNNALLAAKYRTTPSDLSTVMAENYKAIQLQIKTTEEIQHQLKLSEEQNAKLRQQVDGYLSAQAEDLVHTEKLESQLNEAQSANLALQERIKQLEQDQADLKTQLSQKDIPIAPFSFLPTSTLPGLLNKGASANLLQSGRIAAPQPFTFNATPLGKDTSAQSRFTFFKGLPTPNAGAPAGTGLVLNWAAPPKAQLEANPSPANGLGLGGSS